MEIRLKRVYEPPEKSDGLRVLVERLWPRGLKKEKASVDLWVKELAPSPGLRKWFSHDPGKWPEFQKRYRQELKAKKDLVEDLKNKLKKGNTTFVFASKDEIHNSAVVLKAVIGK